MMKFTVLFAMMLFVLAGANAQKASPAAEATATVDGAKVTIKYSQPGVKDRDIWGGLVPFDNVWRTGANAATVFETDKAIMVGGKKIAAGKYGIWTIPGEKEWTWIFNSNWDTWGTNYDASSDVIRVTGDFKSGDMTERMTFTIADGKLSLHWADKVASISIGG